MILAFASRWSATWGSKCPFQPLLDGLAVNVTHRDAILHAGHGGEEADEFRFCLRVRGGVGIVEERWGGF